MRDSTIAADIPLDGLAAVAGYEDLWSSADWALVDRVPVKLVIARFADRIGDILDVEGTLATPAEAPGWCDRFNRPGRRGPTLYHSRSLRAPVLAAMAGRPYDWWAATLDGTQDVPGAVAVQYCGAAGSGDPCQTTGHYDESVILDPTWIMTQAQFDALLAGNPTFQALIWRVGTMLLNLPAVPGGPTQGEANALQAKLASLSNVGNVQPVLDAIAALKADLDALTLKKV